MNKVISIEIARQVFWIEESAYEELQKYLQKIKDQLVNEEFADDIYQDIELRIAELLYNHSGTNKKSLGLNQVERVIEQVGFINEEFEPQDLPRRSYLDSDNKIVGGVCAGLSERWGISAFLLRLVFIALGFLFGLGIVLYLIFWFSLDKNNNKRLNSTEKVQKTSPLLSFQRVLFLPFSLLGTLISIVSSHFQYRKKAYKSLFRSGFSIALLAVSIFIFVILYNLNQVQLFPWYIAWILSLAVMFLIVLFWVKYIKKHYMKLSHQTSDKRIKSAVIVSVLLIFTAVAYFIFATYEYQHEKVSQSFQLQGDELILDINEKMPQENYYSSVDIQIKTHDLPGQQVILHLNYSSEGRNKEIAKQNIQAIDYFYTFEENTLSLDKFWSLNEKALNRSQHLEILIEIPQNITLLSQQKLFLNKRLEPEQYQVRYRDTDSKSNSIEYKYLTSQVYLHEIQINELGKVGSNERFILNDKFCKVFFISESWSCASNIRNLIEENKRFDKAYQNDLTTINQIREFLLPNRSLLISHLEKMKELVEGLSEKEKTFIKQSEFYQYLQHLISLKSTLINESKVNE